MRAPSFPLEDLATGNIVEMKDLWKTQILGDGVRVLYMTLLRDGGRCDGRARRPLRGASRARWTELVSPFIACRAIRRPGSIMSK
jgi:hypothetical protein